MAQPRPLTIILLIGLASAGGFGVWKVWNGQRVEAVKKALESYQRALQTGDETGLRVALARSAWDEFENGGGLTALPLLKGLSPTDSRVDRVEFTGSDRATAFLIANLGTGTAAMVHESGVWRVEKMAWNLTLNPGGERSEKVSEGRPVPKEVQILLDRMAGTDPGDAGEAWLQLGAKYNVTSQFRRDLQQAFNDRRPIPFQIYYSEEQSGGRTFRGYSTKLLAAEAGSNVAQTVGEALRLDMWRMEGLGLAPGGPDPASWWPGYAKTHGIGTAPTGGSGLASSPAPANGASHFSFLDPKIPASGEAKITLDGRTEIFKLGTSFWTDTRMKDPTQAILEFRVPQDGGNPARVRLKFDTTRLGVQAMDGAAVDVVYIADGGQLFPPQGPCEIRIQSAYTDGEGSLLKGEVPQVPIHSAGINHTLALTFEVRGSFQKRP